LAEALITRTPRRLWDVRTGFPAYNSDVVEAVRVIERSIALSDEAGRPQHPAIVHMHIHALEMSNHPENALRSADILGTLCPDAGHMNHMPGHIYVLCGDYERALLASEKAIKADNAYADYAGSFNFYITARCHDLHLMIFTCMFLGQYKGALEAANTIRRILPREILAVRDRPKLAYTTEAYYSMKMHVLVRFGQWQAIIDEAMPEDPELYLISTAMQHYARGVAYATLKDIAAAEEERARIWPNVMSMRHVHEPMEHEHRHRTRRPRQYGRQHDAGQHGNDGDYRPSRLQRRRTQSNCACGLIRSDLCRLG
jgi:tetratricopeptide (TPR) repeat protein